MSEKDVVENVDSPGEIGIPIANNSTPGIASFDSNDFTVGPDGKVNSLVERGIPQYLGKITGTGTGTTDLNWEVDWKSRPTVITNGEEEVDKAKRIKIGEYIMLTTHFNQFVPGDIFRITDVQIEGSKYTVKTNNVRVLSLASIVGKLYLHTVTVMKTVSDVPCYITLKGYSTSNAEVNTWEKLWSFFNLPTFQGGPGPIGISVGYLYWYYVGAGCSLFGNGQSSGPEGMTYVLSLYGSRYSRQTNAYEDMPQTTSDDTSTYSWSSTDTTNPVTITDVVTDL